MNIQRFFIKAFSGIELLVALVIIAVIFLLAYPALNKVQSPALQILPVWWEKFPCSCTGICLIWRK